ncbi:hypothetical protein IKF76_01550 [Candidatus Saccharibacteria bacterium]|nr:hypothetical protein [Candidatus Saccharibacteria bacterium]
MDEHHESHDNHDEQIEKRNTIERQMDEMIKKHDTERSDAQKESVVPPAPKGNKGAIVAIAVVLALVALGLIGYIILDKTVWNKQSGSSNQSQSQTETPDEITASEITDAEIISDLDEKSSILLNLYIQEGATKDYGWDSMVTSSMYNYLDALMADGKLSNEAKVYNVLRHLFYNENAFSKVTASDYTNAEVAEIIKDSVLQGSNPSEFFNYVTKIDADEVAKMYKALYGEDIKHQSAKEICGGFYYDASKGLYLKGLYDACGGINPITYNFYREKYESVGDKAYAYFRVGTVNCEVDETSCTYYSGYFGHDDLAKLEPIGTVNMNAYFDSDDGIITADNFEDFAPYRLVFEKQGDGSYAFVEIEKL